jgi:DHA2 family multidrug resistance protein
VSIDYIGIGLIALTFASFQIMLDRGEDEDWFHRDSSDLRRARRRRRGRRRRLAAVHAQTGGRHPRSQGSKLRARLRRDRCFAMILYGSAVLIPQLAQQHLGYTRLLAGWC